MLIWAIILLVVAIVLIYSFQRLFGKQTITLGKEIDDLADPDNDLIPNKFDCCDNNQGTSALRGCPTEDALGKSECKPG